MTSTTPHYFEGPEKTLEIDWVPSVGHSTSGLRAITREQWEHLLTLAQCCILSTISNEHLDSYVLSESSLFVYTHKMVIKTCGTTTLLRLLPSLLELTVSLGMKLEWLGYMRKNFSFPRNQLYPHSGFAEELQYLETQCHLVGEAYALGPLNADHWNAFVYDDCDRPMSESTDRTLNIMMYDIDPVVAQHFWKKKGSSSTEATVTGDNTKDPEAAEAAAAAAASTEMSEAALKMAADAVTVNSGIHDLLPSTTIQAHVFDPCGYSMNGLLDSAYYTIHVTPETSSSYVSFETTVKMNDYNALVKNVLSTFRPKRFTLTFLADEGALREMTGGHPVEMSSIEIKNQTFCIQYARTARSETTFAGDYCCMMGNWKIKNNNYYNSEKLKATS